MKKVLRAYNIVSAEIMKPVLNFAKAASAFKFANLLTKFWGFSFFKELVSSTLGSKTLNGTLSSSNSFPS